MSGAWQQLEQLLTCAICMDRFKNPKLLPCQHTYCGDPCMEGLIDYARRQIKCPECRAEHRVPYNGVQTLPTNVTLMRFLELHRSITGEEPEPEETMMGRCSVCSEKQHLIACHHCGKKICPDCKEAHLDVMRREIARICANVRRSLSRLEETLKEIKKNEEKITANCSNVREEIFDVVDRCVKDLEKLKDRLVSEIDSYEENEGNTLNRLSEDLEHEVATITANCEVVEKYVDEDHDWADHELVEYKEIFVKTLEFLRNFDADTTDYSRRVRVSAVTDTEQVHKTLTNLLELKVQGTSSTSQTLGGSQQTLPSSLMRSQSDHRLASQFKKMDSRSMLDISQRGDQASDSEDHRGQGRADILRRYGLLPAAGGDDGDGAPAYGSSGRHAGYKSRYVRELLQEQENMMRPQAATASSRHGEDEGRSAGGRQDAEVTTRAFDVEGAVRAPLSGVVKIDDSGKFMERLFESERRAQSRRAEKENQQKMRDQQKLLTQMAQQKMQQQMAAMRAQQQASLEQQQQQQANAGDQDGGTASTERAHTPEPPAAQKDRGSSARPSYGTQSSTASRDQTTSASRAESSTTTRHDDERAASDIARPRRLYLDDSRTSARDSPATRVSGSTGTGDDDRHSYRSSSVSDYSSSRSAGHGTSYAARRQSYVETQPTRIREDSDSESESDESETPSSRHSRGTARSSISSYSTRADEIARSNAEPAKDRRNPYLYSSSSRSTGRSDTTGESSTKPRSLINSRKLWQSSPAYGETISVSSTSEDYPWRRPSTAALPDSSDDSAARRRSLARSKSSALVPETEDEPLSRPSYSSRTYGRTSFSAGGRSAGVTATSAPYSIARSKSSAEIGGSVAEGNDSDEDERFRSHLANYRRRNSKRLTEDAVASTSSPVSSILRSRSSHTLKNSLDQDQDEDANDRSSSWATYLRSKYRTGSTSITSPSDNPAPGIIGSSNGRRYSGSSSGFPRSRSTAHLSGPANSDDDGSDHDDHDKSLPSRRSYSRPSDASAIGTTAYGYYPRRYYRHQF